MPFAELVVTVTIDGSFHYKIPENLSEVLKVGHRVRVSFNNRTTTAFVLSIQPDPPKGIPDNKIKTIEALLDPEPILTEELIKITKFASSYYLTPHGEVLKAALPPGFTGTSKPRFYITAEGKKALTYPLLHPKQKELLELADQSAGLGRAQLKSKIAQELISNGWVEFKDKLATFDGQGEQKFVRQKKSLALAFPYLLNAKSRQKLYHQLNDGPILLDDLKQKWGTKLRPVLKKLIEDDVIEVITLVNKGGKKTSIESIPITISQKNKPQLTDEQQTAVEQLTQTLDDLKNPQTNNAFLLHGVTGSGKTEVYLRVIEHALSLGYGAIILVPEIALTPQLETRFRERFGNLITVLHSAVADGERRKRWLSLRNGNSRIALGPRSAIWAPVANLGVIVVDEEHDGSFKQQSDLRYQGRDLALVRAQQSGAIAILGSATPSMESLIGVENGRLQRLVLSKRVAERPLPSIEVVDLLEERRAMKGDIRLISRPLEDALRETIQKKEQAIIFLNRRGFNTLIHCDNCGDLKKCPHCDVSLTFHKTTNRVHCHYCNYEESLNTPCRSCNHPEVKPLGSGTERLAEIIQELITEARVIRLDRDITRKKGALESRLEEFRQGDADILVGTQMIAKGHDFPKVTLVGIIMADASLAVPDFRAAERTFQLLTQVSGRAGRAEKPGRVVVQCLQPDHFALQTAFEHDHTGFFEIERQSRADLSYPPFSRLGLVRAEHTDPAIAEKTIRTIAQAAHRLRIDNHRVLGPSEAPIGKIKDRFRYMLLLFAPTPAKLVQWMRQIQKATKPNNLKGIVIYDVDATDLL